MGFFSGMHFDSLETLFVVQLQDLYDAEQRLVKALPNMEEAAHDENLKDAFRQHFHETVEHVKRLEKVFAMMGRVAEVKTSQAMKGLLAEGEEVIGGEGDPDVKDAALIAAAQRVEHYEIAGYGTARTFAQQLGMHDAARLLQDTLAEESVTDRKLTLLAERNINAQAALA